jgi:hypothetical protein
MSASYALAFPTDRLFAHALRILDAAAERYCRPFDWTFGGGTVLAMRHGHRYSKDVDIFVPDPQYLGYLTPRLSDEAAAGDPQYEEAAEFVKLLYPEGEVDFVAGPVLTDPGWRPATVDGRSVRLETDVEILAKKLYFRGDRFRARDLFDLAMLLERDPGEADALRPWAQRHIESLLELTGAHADSMRPVFDVIDARGFTPTFGEAVSSVRAFLGTRVRGARP